MKKILLALSLGAAAAHAGPKSVARQWNDMVLECVRHDYARPTVTARNFYHLSIALYDSWALYDKRAANFYINFKREAADVARARHETISFTAYRIIAKRFEKAPDAAYIRAQASALMRSFGYDESFATEDDSPAGTGNLVARMILDNFAYDGSREATGYDTPPELYPPLNPPLIVKLPGVGQILDLNLWQPLALDHQVDQGGFPVPGNIQVPLTLHWGGLPTFALTDADRASNPAVYLDPGPPPAFGGAGHEAYRESMEEVIEFSSWLDPADGVVVDISPRSLGNNSLGANDGHGYAANPFTGQPYAEQRVPRGDYARVLAEFWADGPKSETPPGHWNVVANDVCEAPGFRRRWMGRGPELDPLEWDVKMYLTMNGGLYDASVAAWAIKGYYQGSRPISAIRHMAELGQSSDPRLPRYHPLGLRLRPGLIELVTVENTGPGEKMAHLVGHEGKIAVRSWQGAPSDPSAENLGVDWVLGENWLPYQKSTFVTPPFPGYVSGHSTYSRTAAEILTAITGSRYFPNGMGEYLFKAGRGLTFEHGPSHDVRLQWATYADAADQSARSRIYGGIHGSIDDLPARKIGFTIGRRAVAKTNALFTR